MSIREEERRKNSSSSRGLAVAAAAIGVGVGAALYYFFSKRQEYPDQEGSTSGNWSTAEPQTLNTNRYNISSDSSSSSEDEHTPSSFFGYHNSKTDDDDSETSCEENGNDSDEDDMMEAEENENDSDEDDMMEAEENENDSDEDDMIEAEENEEDSNETRESNFSEVDTDTELEIIQSEDDGEETEESNVSAVDTDGGEIFQSEDEGEETEENNISAVDTYEMDMEVLESEHNDESLSSELSNEWISDSFVDMPSFESLLIPSGPIQILSGPIQILDNISSFVNRHLRDRSTLSDFFTYRRERPLNRRPITEDERARLQREQAFRERLWSLEECAICFDAMLKDQPLMQLPCTHNFHVACIGPWLQERQTCPVCRKSTES